MKMGHYWRRVRDLYRTMSYILHIMYYEVTKLLSEKPQVCLA